MITDEKVEAAFFKGLGASRSYATKADVARKLEKVLRLSTNASNRVGYAIRAGLNYGIQLHRRELRRPVWAAEAKAKAKAKAEEAKASAAKAKADAQLKQQALKDLKRVEAAVLMSTTAQWYSVFQDNFAVLRERAFEGSTAAEAAAARGIEIDALDARKSRVTKRVRQHPTCSQALRKYLAGLAWSR